MTSSPVGIIAANRRRGGAGGLPSSVTHLVRPAAMAFSGGNLTGIVDEVAASSSYFSLTGTLPGDTTNGYQMSEANSGAYVTLTSLVAGAHLALRFKRNGTADNQTVLLGGTTNTRYSGACESGSSSTTTSAGHAVTSFIYNGTTYTTPTRGTIWTDFMGDTVEKVVVFRALTESSAELRLGWYQVASWIFEGTIGGWARFTDISQAAAVSAFLLSSDPV